MLEDAAYDILEFPFPAQGNYRTFWRRPTSQQYAAFHFFKVLHQMLLKNLGDNQAGIHFIEVSPLEIRESYPSYFHEGGRYFKAVKDGKALCLYGIISRPNNAGEAFLMMKTFQGRVLGKGFFLSLFSHAFSLGYTEIYTWTTWDRLIKLFRRFKGVGIEKAGCPPWDNESTVDPRRSKTWFIKRIQ